MTPEITGNRVGGVAVNIPFTHAMPLTSTSPGVVSDLPRAYAGKGYPFLPEERIATRELAARHLSAAPARSC